MCEDSFLAWLANSMLFFGWAVGAVVLGVISDAYGRRSVLFPSIFIVLVVTFAMSFSRVFWIVAVCRAVIGFFEAGCFLSMFVLATELVGPEKRALAGTLVWIYFTFALMVHGIAGLLHSHMASSSSHIVSTLDFHPRLLQVSQRMNMSLSYSRTDQFFIPC